MKSKMFKKLMAAAIATTMTVSLAACNKTPDTASESSQAPVETGDTSSVESTEETQTGLTNILTDENGNVYDLGGMEITIRDWFSSTEPQEARNAYEEAQQEYREWIQETYNFKIKQIPVSEWANVPADFIEYAQTDPDENNYIFVMRNDPSLITAMKNGLVYDLKTLDCLDFSEEKFQQNRVHELYTIGGHTYAMSAGLPEPRTGVYFNKRLLKDAGIDPDSIYDMQANGTWTWDALVDLMSKVHRDTDNDGKIDVFAGNCNNSMFPAAAVYSNGGEFIGKDASGKYVYKLDDPKTTEALEWAVDVFNTYWQNDPADQAWDYYKDAFKNGEYVFMFEDAYAAQRGQYLFDENDEFDDFGFVMFPKGPQASDYTNCWTDNSYVIPNNYDADRAWKIAFAWNLYTNEVPGYEDSDNWKNSYYDGFSDTRAVDETLAMMKVKGMITFHDIIPGVEFGPQFIWNVGPGAVVSEKVEAIADTWKAYIDEANR